MKRMMGSMHRVLAVLAIAGLLAACGPAGTAEPPTDPVATAAPAENDAVTTILQFAVSGVDQERYQTLIDTFESENPGVHVSTVSIEQTLGVRGMGGDTSSWPDDGWLRLASEADVIAAPASRAAVQQGALLDLSQLLETDSALNAEAFYPGLLESMQWNGGTWSLPTDATYSLIYYNKTLFDAAGVAYPEPGWTWDDFVATAQALTVGSGDNVSQWGFVEPSFDPVTFVQARAGLLFDANTYPPAARLDDPAVIAGVRWYTDLFRTYGVSPYYSTSGQGNPGGMFNNETMRVIADGQAAMWFMGSAGGFRVAFAGRGGPDQQQQTTGVVPFPVNNPTDHSTPAVVEGLSISAGTQKADLAWKWVSFLVQQTGGQRGPFQAVSSGSLPALPSVAAAAGTWDNLDEGVAAALQYATEHAYIDTYDGSEYDLFRSAVVDVMDNGTDIQTALSGAQTEAEASIEETVAAQPTAVANLVVADEEQQAINSGATMINFGVAEGGPRFGQQSLSNLVDQFQAEHPDIVVEVGSPQGFRGQLGLADMAAEFDCFQSSPSFDSDSLAAIVNVEPFLAADSTTRKEDFFPSVLAQFTYQGQVWGLPGSVTIPVILYNKDLFDAAQVPYPTVGWTTSDFLETAVNLTQGQDENKQYGYVSSSFGTTDLVTFMDRLGANMLDESVDPPRLVFDAPDVMEAFRWYTSLATQYDVQPVVDQSTGDFRGGRGSQALINEGRAAMWLSSGGGGNIFFGGGNGFGGAGGQGGNNNLNTGVVPLPTGLNSTKGSGFQSVDGYFISAETEARQACWSWITFLTEQPSVATGLPARQSVAQSDEYRQRVGADLADAYLASVNSGSEASFFQRVSDEGNWLGMASFWLSDAYTKVVNGDATVEEALSAAQESVDSFRDCIIANDAYTDPQTMAQCIAETGLDIGGGVRISVP